jgi:hypothetical protein
MIFIAMFSFADEQSGKLLAAVASIGDLLILWVMDKEIARREGGSN